MDKTIGDAPRTATFNGILEAGVRAVTLLTAAFPRRYDLQRLVAFDYLLVHSGDIGGPESLHPSSPLHEAALLVRRDLVERGLMLMMTKHLVEREIGERGFEYSAGESAVPFVSSMNAPYLMGLRERARWLVEVLGAQGDIQFNNTLRRILGPWTHEFEDRPGDR
jgi:hypothetical protein